MALETSPEGVTELAFQVLLHALGMDGAFSVERSQYFIGMFCRHRALCQVNGHGFFFAHLSALFSVFDLPKFPPPPPKA
jgi:hypothetical protein